MLKDEYTAVNIRDYLLDNHSEITGEQILINLFSGFSCPSNPNVEKFLKENAVNFTKKNQSVTYLVFSEKTATIVGYFTLAIKPITVKWRNCSIEQVAWRFFWNLKIIPNWYSFIPKKITLKNLVSEKMKKH